VTTSSDPSFPSQTRDIRRVVLAGIGSPYRRDDAVGQLVVERVASLDIGVADIGPISEPLDLLGLWDGADLAVIVDAVRSGRPPGTVTHLELEPADRAATPGEAAEEQVASTHGIGLAGVVRLAQAVGNAPRRVVLVGIEGQDFGQGIGLSPAVAEALPEAVSRVLHLLEVTR
jgi:hydrogenase maturation protease